MPDRRAPPRRSVALAAARPGLAVPPRVGCATLISGCRFIDVRAASTLYRLLGDDARLRLLRMLRRERLNVTELTGVLGLAQSGVSRHLGLLKDARLVIEEKDAGFHLLSARACGRGRWTTGAVGRARGAVRPRPADPAVRADDARLQEVLRLRKENFETHGGADARDARQLVPGRSWAAWSRALGLLLPPLQVADLGCGEGYLTIEAARWASPCHRRRSFRRSYSSGPGTRPPPARVQRRLEAGRTREAADQGRRGRRGVALAGTAPRPESGAGASRRRSVSR